MVNGAMLALDDWLEMESLKNMHGAPYQVLCQSKIVITALLSIPLKGVYQTKAQWMLLIALMCGMSLYMCQGSERESGSDIPFYAYVVVISKVTWSCFAAVYVDKFSKDPCLCKWHKPILHVGSSLVYSSAARLQCGPTDLKASSMDGMHSQYAVIVSFCVKGTFSFMLVAVLDAILKNMGECVAVLLIYFYSVLAPWDSVEFDMPTFLAVMVVIFVIGVYADSKHNKLPVPSAKS
eukprot:CAMPEP_0169327428 /NCGR_PEP_ID=MMETSP1017-20121227/12047_1 /TAXON_ID=342587 /ORGANISM="Karlodinium micrum, Strain CCMP2283" /LENGTH=235 /DNA_ID=CAMNT_0009422235 /DNA_START=954 /DNA_END=1660 /DNA_ORIENTATION=+